MRVVSTVNEGEAIVAHLRHFDHVHTQGYFGRLSFSIDVSKLTVNKAEELISDIDEVDDIFNCYIDEERVIEFDYYVTSDLLPELRGIVDMYCNPYDQGVLLYWTFDNIMTER